MSGTLRGPLTKTSGRPLEASPFRARRVSNLVGSNLQQSKKTVSSPPCRMTFHSSVPELAILWAINAPRRVDEVQDIIVGVGRFPRKVNPRHQPQQQSPREYRYGNVRCLHRSIGT